MTLLAFLSALGTVFMPVLSVLLAAWVQKKQEASIHEALIEADRSIAQTLAGDPIGLANLSQQLERLSREAQRKNHS